MIGRIVKNALMFNRSSRKDATDKITRDILVLWKFQEIFCRENHQDQHKNTIVLHGLVADAVGVAGPELCEDCAKTFLHGATKRAICPYDPKPACKHCSTPCYQPGYREQMREVMRFSGMWLIKHGRLHLIWKYFF